MYVVTDGIEPALSQARAAAGDKDVSIAGGARTVRQFLAVGLLDELYLHIARSSSARASGCSRTSATPSWNR